ncbi:MAG: CPBP family intramembrane metalloprotease [Sediminibacterium sp.]|nr:CPBP family intramembrane metalloprotease [Sediminibacterium sp.]MDP3127611.1 CPBP family intramembrane metalloprotease [Sediminibacterium sp.]
MSQRSTINYPLQFAFLLGLMGVFIVLTAFLVPFIGSLWMEVPFMQVTDRLNRPENIHISRVLNTLASLMVFLLPALFLARILSKQPFTQLGFNTAISRKQVFWICLILFAGIMLSGALGELNEKMPIPAKWYVKARALEEAYKAAMLSMATMKTPLDYVLTLGVLAAAPALFEEVLFRSGFQQVFIGWTNNKWAGILIASIVFSSFHFSYFGFLPRVALGVLLGLIFYYSKNIWLSIFLHFLNNAFVVTQLYIASGMGKSFSKTMDERIPFWWGIIAVLLLFVFFRSFKKESDLVLANRENKPNLIF